MQTWDGLFGLHSEGIDPDQFLPHRSGESPVGAQGQVRPDDTIANNLDTIGDSPADEFDFRTLVLQDEPVRRVRLAAAHAQHLDAMSRKHGEGGVKMRLHHEFQPFQHGLVTGNQDWISRRGESGPMFVQLARHTLLLFCQRHGLNLYFLPRSFRQCGCLTSGSSRPQPVSSTASPAMAARPPMEY